MSYLDIFFIDDEEKVMGPCQTKEQIAERRCTHREMVTTTLVWCGRWAEMFYKGATENVPLYDVHADMTAESCPKWNAIRRFEMDFPLHYTDNIESGHSGQYWMMILGNVVSTGSFKQEKEGHTYEHPLCKRTFLFYGLTLAELS